MDKSLGRGKVHQFRNRKNLVLIPLFLWTTNLYSQEILIKDVDLIPMTDEVTIPGVSILVTDGVISAIGDWESFDLGEDVTVLNANGKYLIPGLIEMHVHVREKEVLSKYLEYGFTTVRNMNGNFGDPIKWQEEIVAGTLLAPDLFTSSPTIIGDRHARAIRPSYPYAIRSEEEARVMARKFKEKGYNLIKIFRLERGPFFALIDEARKQDIYVSGHLPDVNIDGDSIDYQDVSTVEILDTGMGVEHIAEFTKEAFKHDKSKQRLELIMEKLRQNNTTVATLLGSDVRYHGLRYQGHDFLTDSLIELTESNFGPEGVDRLESIIADQPDVDLSENNSLEFVLSVLKEMNNAGINLVIGTDSHDVVNPAGVSSLQELDFLVQAGLSNFDALKCATINAAKALGEADRIGTVEIGKKANFVLLEANPLDDLKTLSKPHLVILRGNILPRK